MHCGTPGRTPPRRPAFVGRLIRPVLLSVLALAIWAGPASSTPCAPKAGTRTLAGHVGTGEKECQPSMPFQRRGNADPLSFVFFIGAVAAVLLIPVAFRRREDLPPE
ncbi:MAG: hypothetical protein AABM30_08370 [Actinomycetota bacterium]